MKTKRNLIWSWASLGALLVIATALLLSACTTGSTTNASPPATAPAAGISPAQAYTKYQQGSFFLDVRTQAEWDQFHIKGSTLIPLEDLQTRLNELPKNKDIVVICQAGPRSQSGAAILQQAGFTSISYVNGGYQAWMSAGYPVEAGKP